MTTPILLLAAGSASRMRGGDKLLEDVHGAPCLQVMAKRALATGQPVLVTMPSLNHPRAACLTGLELSVIEVPNADLGMSHSLQRGVAALPNNAKAVMILPADMPDITTDDMNEMLEAFVGTNATTLVGMNLFEQFQKLTGDKGANAILSALGDSLMLHALKGDRARIDLDTPEDWSAWRARTQ